MIVLGILLAWSTVIMATVISSQDVILTISETSESSATYATLVLTHRFLRNCTLPIIPQVNIVLKTVQLVENVALERNLASIRRKVQSSASKIPRNHGLKRKTFDSKIKEVRITENDFVLQSRVHKSNELSSETSQSQKTASGDSEYVVTTGLISGPETPTRRPLSDLAAQRNVPATPPLQSLQDSPNTGVRLDNVKSGSHKKRIQQSLEKCTVQALDFVESYGVIPKKLVCESFNGDVCVVNVDGCDRSKKSYANMSSIRKEEVKTVLNICDRAMISDSAYHELAKVSSELPRKNHLVSCRNEMNVQFNVKRTPGLQPGAFLSLTEEIRREITTMVESGQDIHGPLTVKVSGDGARVSRISNFVNISFCLVSGKTTVAHTDQKVVAIVSCDENYMNLKSCLLPLFKEINELNSAGMIRVQDRSYELEMLIGGDMKFIQLLLGLNGSIGTYACPWCKVPKDDRGTMDLPEDHYHSDKMLRTMNEITDMARSGKSGKLSYGVKEQPLLNIEPIKYIPDELHLLLRITDILLRNIINDARSKDDFGRLMGQSTDNLDLLVKSIQSCGVTFKVWFSRSGELEWTSLSGVAKKRLLRQLPPKLLFCLHDDTRAHIQQLWQKFETVYSMVCHGEHADELFHQCQEFVNMFLSIGRMNREGYAPKDVTPYMHVLVFHTPYFVKKYGGLAKFSSQGVEKANDVIKTIHQKKTNKLDPTVDALLVRKRIELNSTRSRSARTYAKTNEQYWNIEIKTKALSKKRKIDDEMKDAHAQFNDSHANYENLSVKDIKKQLALLGISTKLRKREKLLELLEQATLLN